MTPATNEETMSEQVEQKVVIYGASDDLVELRGALAEEFYADECGNLLAFSDGTLLKIWYDNDGCWRIARVAGGSAEFSKVEAEGPDSKNYSDRVTLRGEFTWVVCAPVQGNAKVVANRADAAPGD